MAAQEVILKYSIHQSSSHSTTFVPENILTDNPSDGTSRWSSESNNPPQFLILKLFGPAVVQSICFGKYEKSHVCNMKKFKVYGGLSDDSMIELLDNGLKNNNQSETFTLKHTAGENMFACKFIKIVPIQSWGPSFNFSIWHVQLKGIEDWEVVKSAVGWFNYYREKETIRLCLKHFRQHNYTEAFESLQKRTRIQLEDELLSKLHQHLVVDGDYLAAEHLLISAARDGCLDHYLEKQTHNAKWVPLIPPPKTSENEENRPGMRGGHQMVIDVHSETIYLFGGWDGTTDLSDMWSYLIPSGSWTRLSSDTVAEGGPSPRSCHKMCLDPERKKIFTIGRYLDSQMRQPKFMKSDFFMYDIDSNRWTLITDDTSAMGGPSLIFDHQLCIDVQKNTLYVFGGRILTSMSTVSNDEPTPVCNTEPSFSGLYSYHVPTNTWTKLHEDCPKPSGGYLRSRIGHSMLFHEKTRQLYIFAGQRQKEYLTDFFTYKVDTDQIEIICDGSDLEVPPAGFTQRATIDPELNEIHVLSGSNKDKREEYVKNSFWVYDISHNKWQCIYQTDVREHQENSKNLDAPLEPCPRFAHQLVYDHVKKVHYLFGGNPGKSNSPKMRLDDFWSLYLHRPTKEDVLRQICRMMRQNKFEEIAAQDQIAALNYLQTELHNAVDHENVQEEKEFQLLVFHLFKDKENEVKDELSVDEVLQRRSQLFDMLTAYFPENMTQPKENLIDLISL